MNKPAFSVCTVKRTQRSTKIVFRDTDCWSLQRSLPTPETNHEDDEPLCINKTLRTSLVTVHMAVVCGGNTIPDTTAAQWVAAGAFGRGCLHSRTHRAKNTMQIPFSYFPVTVELHFNNSRSGSELFETLHNRSEIF